MREAERFEDIIKREFSEEVPPTPPTAEPGEPEPPAVSDPVDDFHLDLYMGEEEYKSVSADTWRLGHLTIWGLAAIGLGVILAVVRVTVPAHVWVGWVSGVCLVVGLALCIAQALRSHQSPDDDGAVV